MRIYSVVGNITKNIRESVILFMVVGKKSKAERGFSPCALYKLSTVLKCDARRARIIGA